MTIPSSYVDRIKANRVGNLFLVRGFDRGRQCWHYVQVELSKAPIFEQIASQGDLVDYTQYGKVIITGWGENPPYKIQEMIKQKGANIQLSEQEMDQEIFFVQNSDNTGREFYSFVGVPNFLGEEFQQKCMIGSFDLLEYGYIIESAWGKPTEFVLQKMENNFDFDRSKIAHLLEPSA